MEIKDGAVVTLKYQLFSIDPDNPSKKILLEERVGNNPLEFLYGQGLLVKKVEESLLGQGAGFKNQVTLQPQEAFGPYRDDLRIWLPRQKFPKEMEVILGMKFQTQGPDGQVMAVVVKEIKDEEVLIDGNHPLAGLQLFFDLEVLRIRAATEDELRQKKVLQVYH